jgi:phosphoadenosine phosphosulfate reductase
MKIEELIKQTKEISWQEKLKFVSSLEKKVIFSTSFSIEDQVILDFISKNNLKIEVFAIDTGRLPSATYTVWQESLEKYKAKIIAYYPDAAQIENFVKNKGINSFYQSEDLRHQCCNIRKVEPLKRALKNQELWVSGVRKEHSNLRDQKEFFEHDNNLNIDKFYPLLELSEDEVWDYINKNDIPYNKLYDQGYKSIGCDPCSRAINKGDDPRSGRWWWEEGNKECGLHMVDGKLVRKNN